MAVESPLRSRASRTSGSAVLPGGRAYCALEHPEQAGTRPAGQNSRL